MKLSKKWVIKTSLRKNLWDEENRLIAVDLKPEESTGHRLLIMLRGIYIKHDFDP